MRAPGLLGLGIALFDAWKIAKRQQRLALSKLKRQRGAETNKPQPKQKGTSCPS
jgi:hypothetical protein